ncbi:hypothetical protein [Azospirillum picis]|uniref:Uncharacterized protein n=1 Tax=Azospirillum picis TaxID=488438 RepID=A0ABU0MUK1_9PROT|nr:hypothetical protein [Azospirillum picis]MBP2303303.1 hypothetical protein [Azospirillum picis]MDQ0537157.1 hypothetical protein [Azospirillum picis]
MRMTSPALGRLGDRAAHLFRRQPGEDVQLLDHRPEGEPIVGEVVDQTGQSVNDETGAILAGEGEGGDHVGVAPAVDTETVDQRGRESLWKVGLPFHNRVELAGAVERVTRPAARLINRNKPESLSYAMTAAVNALGVKEVSEVTGLSKSAVYAGCDASDSSRGFPALPFETVLKLSVMMNRVGGRGEVFALPFLLRSAEARAPVAHSAHLLHQASHVTALYGRTAAALCKLFDRAENAHRPVPLDPRERDEAVAAIDATIEGLTALKSQLLTSTCLPPLFPLPMQAEETEP